MDKRSRLGAFSAIFAITAMSSCRDETSDSPKRGKEPPKTTTPVTLAESNQETPLPPFVLKEGSYVLSERSTPGQTQPQLEDFLLSATGSALAKEAGVEVKINDDLTELLLTKDLALAFSNIGTKNPISIKTQGHNLTLIGNTLKNLKVETKAAGQKSGDVTIYALQEVSGEFDLRGADGEAGADGLCPSGFDDCARVPGQAFSATTLQPQIERRQEEHVVQDVGAYANRLAFLPFLMPSPPVDGLGRCVPVMNSPTLKEINERFDGQLILRRRVPTVTWQGDLKGKDGWLSPGKPGSIGQNAGKITVTAPPEAIVNIIHQGSGGRGGVTGSPGIVQPAPQPGATHFSADTQVELDASGASKVYNFKLGWTMTHANPCVRGSCPVCSLELRAGEQKQSSTNPLHNWTEPNNFAPPETFAGDMPTLVEPEPAQAGADGIFEQTKNQDLQTISIDEVELPLSDLIDSNSK